LKLEKWHTIPFPGLHVIVHVLETSGNMLNQLISHRKFFSSSFTESGSYTVSVELVTENLYPDPTVSVKSFLHIILIIFKGYIIVNKFTSTTNTTKLH